MTDQLIIRQEMASDFKEVFEVNRMAFAQDNEAKLVAALRNNRTVFVPELSIVATTNDKIIGHILFTKIIIKDDNGNNNESVGLAPMAVLPQWQNCGIGRQLIQKGLEEARRLHFKSVVVLGHENYYPKFGFEPAIKWNIKAPFEVPPNSFMAMELVNDGLKNISGTVIYSAEFTAV